MLFGPWRSSVIFALELAARSIVVLIDCFFNQPACDVRIYPLIEFDPIKADTFAAVAFAINYLCAKSAMDLARALRETTRCHIRAAKPAQALYGAGPARS